MKAIMTILRSEVEKVVSSSKAGKSTGFDKIPAEPAEVLRFPIIVDVLHFLFNLELSPSLWRKAMTTPKNATQDKRVPLIYRGTSLLSIVGKLYSSVLNNKLLWRITVC